VAESLSFERIADRYDETRGGAERGRHAAAILDGLLDLGRLTLEVGVGTGLVADGLAELGHRLVGVDLSPSMAAKAVGRIGPRVAVADARHLPLEDGLFAQAYSVWVLHLVADIRGVLAEVARVLQPGGRYVVVPAYGQYADAGDLFGQLFHEMWDALDPEGIRRDDEPRLRELAPAAGLRMDDAFRGPDLIREESPATLIRNMEERVFSILWDVDEDRWRRHVEPVLQELRQLPDLDVPIDRPLPFNVVVLERDLSLDLVREPGALFAARIGVVQALGGAIVRRRVPLEVGRPALTGRGHACVDKRSPDASSSDPFRDEQVVHQHGVASLRRAVEPVQGGESDQLPVNPRSQEQALVAGLDETGEEPPVPVVVGLRLVEPLVPGYQGQRRLELVLS